MHSNILGSQDRCTGIHTCWHSVFHFGFYFQQREYQTSLHRSTLMVWCLYGCSMILVWYSEMKISENWLTCISIYLEVKTVALAFIPVGTQCSVSVSAPNKVNIKPLYIEVHVCCDIFTNKTYLLCGILNPNFRKWMTCISISLAIKIDALAFIPVGTYCSIVPLLFLLPRKRTLKCHSYIRDCWNSHGLV